MSKDPKVTFSTGSFDNWQGTQQELDAFVTELQEMISSPEFLKTAVKVDMDQLQEDNPDLYKAVMENILDMDTTKRLN